MEVKPRAPAHALPQLEATQVAREPVRGTATCQPLPNTVHDFFPLMAHSNYDNCSIFTEPLT